MVTYTHARARTHTHTHTPPPSHHTERQLYFLKYINNKLILIFIFIYRYRGVHVYEVCIQYDRVPGTQLHVDGTFLGKYPIKGFPSYGHL